MTEGDFPPPPKSKNRSIKGDDRIVLNRIIKDPGPRRSGRTSALIRAAKAEALARNGTTYFVVHSYTFAMYCMRSLSYLWEYWGASDMSMKYDHSNAAVRFLIQENAAEYLRGRRDLKGRVFFDHTVPAFDLDTQALLGMR